MVTLMKLPGREVASSCLLAVSEPRPQGTRVSGVSRLGLGARDERPTKALLVSASAQVPSYAAVSTGADLQQQAWVNGHFASDITAAKQHNMRAFRGPEPWKEPT